MMVMETIDKGKIIGPRIASAGNNANEQDDTLV